MKRNILKIFFTGLFFVMSFVIFAQTDSPENTGGNQNGQDGGGTPADPGGTGDPLGGGAPIGSGAAILIGLGAAYGGRKVYKLYKDNQEELES